MRTALLLVLLLVAAGWQTAFADEDPKWICVAEASTGFMNQGGKWVIAEFNVNELRYLVSKKTGPLGFRYYVVQFGEKYGAFCGEDAPSSIGFIRCESLLGTTEFLININTLRYLAVYLSGYTNEGADSNDTPYIERGTCSPL